MDLERKRGSIRQRCEELGLVEEVELCIDATVLGEAVLDHDDRKVLERGHDEVARSEGAVEVAYAITVDDHVQAPDACGVVCEEGLEPADTLLLHVDWPGDVELRAPRALHETLRGAEMVVLAHRRPERRRAQRDGPPFLAHMRSRDDVRATAEETEDVAEELRREAVDGPQMASQDAESV